jgi:protein-tyrosine-phosphatase
MAKVVTTKSLVTSSPVLDPKGKPVTEEVKFNGRKVTHEVHEHTQHKADTVITVDAKTAKALIEAGHAREHTAGIDDDIVDPTKSDPLA